MGSIFPLFLRNNFKISSISQIFENFSKISPKCLKKFFKTFQESGNFLKYFIQISHLQFLYYFTPKFRKMSSNRT